MKQSDDPGRTPVIPRPHANGLVLWTPSGCMENDDCVDDATGDGDATHVTTAQAGRVDMYKV